VASVLPALTERKEGSFWYLSPITCGRHYRLGIVGWVSRDYKASLLLAALPLQMETSMSVKVIHFAFDQF
jgi:hypothetical protein